MTLNIYEDYQTLSQATADAIVKVIKTNPEAVICLPSGDTPRLTCELFVKQVIEERSDLSHITFIGLDEWVGIPPDNEGSCHYFFQHELFQYLSLSKQQVYLFNGLSNDLETECAKMNTVVSEKGRIDLMVVGIGMNGHIGFNEPGVSFGTYSHVTDLDATTTIVGQKYFKSEMPLQKGITLGLKHLSEAKEVLLIANGAKKAGIIKKTVEGEVTNCIPASIMQTHANGFIMIDKEAASLLDKVSS
ncbi:MAG: glucosamine-6-phosphate deaminase [Ginsengibacter sp.]